MKSIGNLLWLIFGGFVSFLGYAILGILWCLTIVGIPIGLQAFKFAKLSLFPFGKEVVYTGDTGSFIINILWLIFGGVEMAMVHLVSAVVLAITIIGLPFAKQHLKLARLSLFPVGSRIIDNYGEYDYGNIDEVFSRRG